MALFSLSPRRRSALTFALAIANVLSIRALNDSRLIAYVGNWQTCPTVAQYTPYTHMVVAFAVSYSWSVGGNICNTDCSINTLAGNTVPICQNTVTDTSTWRNAGKKVVLSFGGAGMGGSWIGDTNHCWDYCFGKEDTLSTALVNIVNNQNFDGIDIDYEYCYDIAGSQAGRCADGDTSLYADEKAQTF
mmetsp:Transcript_25022/g.52269  ORF Transcript_25022/g.52269 Transcript_25022/m.52269 type:complete len:189 (+) Transcript_25022:78-644(+)